MPEKPALHKRCKGCTRNNGKWCATFKYPSKMWEKGKCWAYTTDPDWFVNFIEASKKYIKQIYGKISSEVQIKTLIKEYTTWLDT